MAYYEKFWLIVKNYNVNQAKGGQQSQLLYVNSPVKQPPVHEICPNFAWRVQMGLGSHEKKIEAMQPLTSDFHILASIKCPVKHQPVDHWDQDFAWRVQMGLGLHEKKWRPYGL